MKLECKYIALLAVGILAGCASHPPLAPRPDVEQISFRPQLPPFCGRCESIDVVATADGQLFIERGHWRGNYRNWVRRREVRQITPAQFAEFKRLLEPYKPSHDTSPSDAACASYITDNDGAIVQWIGGDEPRRRVFDFGCLDDRAMNEAVRAAPKALGL